MRRLRKTATALLVWVTAASALVASTPHFVCRCPDGTVKQFCFGSTSGDSPCCCGGGKCCSSSNSSCCKKSASASKRKSSCQKQESKNGSEPGTCCNPGGTAKAAGRGVGTRPEGLAIGRICCQKTLAQQVDRVLVRPEAQSNTQNQMVVSVLPMEDFGHIVALAVSGNTVWQVTRLPPPTDLVTLLQHLTI